MEEDQVNIDQEIENFQKVTVGTGDPGASSHAATTAKPTDTEKPVEKSDGTDWQAKYNGARGYAQQQRQRADALEAKYNALFANHETELGNKDARIAELEKTHTDLQTELGSANSTLSKIKRQTEIGKLVREKFPALQDLYDDLATEGKEGEELETYLQGVADKLDGKVSTAARETLKGASPSRPSGQRAAMTSEEIMDKMMSTAPGTAEHDTLMQQYETALAAEDSKSKSS